MSVVVIIWFVGLLLSGFVFRARADVRGGGRVRVFGPGGVGLEWLAVNIGKGLVWPVTLIVWLVRGRPEPRIVFNDKAARLRAANGGTGSTSANPLV